MNIFVGLFLVLWLFWPILLFLGFASLVGFKTKVKGTPRLLRFIVIIIPVSIFIYLLTSFTINFSLTSALSGSTANVSEILQETFRIDLTVMFPLFTLLVLGVLSMYGGVLIKYLKTRNTRSN